MYKNHKFRFSFQFRIWPAVLRQSTYGTIKFGIYYTLKNWIDHPDVEDMMTNIFCGVIAGSISSAIANPTDVLKVRMQACSTSLQKKGMFECFGDVYRQEGLSGLWRVSSNDNFILISTTINIYLFIYLGGRSNSSKSCSDHCRRVTYLWYLQAPVDTK